MASPPEGGGEPLKFLRAGHSPDLLRQLRRGKFPVEDEFDLHGMNRHQAARAAAAFLDDAIDQELRCVRIVHGKGAVLRELLREQLPGRSEILAFVQPADAEGGSGALLVLLRPRPR